MSHFDDLTAVVMVVKVKSNVLFIGPYSSSQQRLFDRASVSKLDLWQFELTFQLWTRVNCCLTTFCAQRGAGACFCNAPDSKTTARWADGTVDSRACATAVAATGL